MHLGLVAVLPVEDAAYCYRQSSVVCVSVCHHAAVSAAKRLTVRDAVLVLEKFAELCGRG